MYAGGKKLMSGFPFSSLFPAQITPQCCPADSQLPGGGGTVAKYVANQDIDTIDIGVPVLSMHSPFEIVSKADVYMAYLPSRPSAKTRSKLHPAGQQ